MHHPEEAPRGDRPAQRRRRPKRAACWPWVAGLLGLLLGCGGNNARPAAGLHDAGAQAGDAPGADLVQVDAAVAVDAPTPDAAAVADSAVATGDAATSAWQSTPLQLAKSSDFGWNPRLGVDSSGSYLLLLVQAPLTAAVVDEVVAVSGGFIRGAVPKAGVLQLGFAGDLDFAALEQKLQACKKLPGVVAVAEDLPMGSAIVPKANPTGPGMETDWSWGLPEGYNWGLEAMRAPLAWNLNRHVQLAATPTPVVAVIDVDFPAHPDLDLAGEPGPLTGDTHGLSVASVIGATWGNGNGIDGIAPRVSIEPLAYSATGETQLAFVESFVSILKASTSALEALPMRPRVVNISKGYNWHSRCTGSPSRRCDPSADSLLPSSDQSCSPSQRANLRSLIADHGKIFAAIVTAAQATGGGELLFVVSANNDAGKVGVGPGDSYCALVADGKPVAAGLGPDYPQDLTSPMVWAASHDAAASAHLIVAEAAETALEPGFGAVTRVSFSNAKAAGSLAHSVFAPGAQLGALTIQAGKPDVAVVAGTSFAAPYVAGAAAYLLSVEPKLSDAALIALLTSKAHAAPMAGAGSLTDTMVDLFAAVVGIDAVWVGHVPPVRQWFCDMDDGTADGFQRLSDGAVWPYDAGGDGKVDLADFRRLRDNYYMMIGALKPTGLDGLSNPKWDLNGDGTISKPTDEVDARALLYDSASLLIDNTSHPYGSENLKIMEVCQEVYWTDKVQPWPAEALPALLQASADLHVRAAKALAAKGVSQVEVRVTDTTGSLPAPWNAYSEALQKLMIGSDEVILTVPLLVPGVRLGWRANSADPFQELDIDALTLGQDRVVDLDVCSKPTAKLQPANFATSSICWSDPVDCALCLSPCGICNNAKLTLSAKGSAAADGSTTGLSYAWSVVPSPNMSCVLKKLNTGSDQSNALECIFGKTPACSQVLNESATVTLTVSNGCAKSTTTLKIPITCTAKFSGC